MAHVWYITFERFFCYMKTLHLKGLFANKIENFMTNTLALKYKAHILISNDLVQNTYHILALNLANCTKVHFASFLQGQSTQTGFFELAL